MRIAKLDRTTDIWSWAVSVLHMFAGEVTWIVGAVADCALEGYLDEGPMDQGIPHMPAPMVNLLRRCFKEEPSEHYQTMLEVAERLREIYGQVTGAAYPREYPKAAADTAQRQSAGMSGIPGYTLGPALDGGGRCDVYLATRDRDGARVAVKVLCRPHAYLRWHGNKGFQYEMDVTMSLKHRNIVTCYEHGSMGPRFFLVLEFCEGGSVYQLMEKSGGKLPIEIAGPIMDQSLEGLAHVHESRCVHRHLHPRHILLTAESEGIAKIAGMGLAKNFQQFACDITLCPGALVGTPAFMPKEQLDFFEGVRPPTDVWSMGATFYCMLTGMPPREVMQGWSPEELIIKGRIVPIRDRDESIPRNLAAVIDKALSDRPEDRYQDAREFLTALREVWGPAAR